MAQDGGTFTFTIAPRADLSDIKKHIGELQSSFEKLKLPKNLGTQLKDQIDTFNKVLKEYDKQRTSDIKQPGDLKKLDKTGTELVNVYKDILATAKEIQGLDLDNLLDFNSGRLKEITNEIKSIKQEFNNLDNIDGLETLNNQVQKLANSTGSKNIKAIAKEAQSAFQEKNFVGLYSALDKMNDYLGGTGKTSRAFNSLKKGGVDSAQGIAAAFKEAFTNIGLGESEIANILQRLADKERELTTEVTTQSGAINKSLDQIGENGERNVKAIKETNQAIHESGQSVLQLSKNAEALDRQVESYFGLNAIFRTVANMAREAMNTVKELDKAMTETAVVTNFKVSDMWNKLPIYTAQANALGTTIKDVYEATTLYYQQGLNTNQAMGLANETLKMARIAGMDAKDATDAMTAALRGFNLELNQVSAQRINDVYSELAAITASDTQEISTAMEKVASLAHNAGMEVETTSAFLAQMIETTREAPENLGTALKTVVARFQEMKQDPTKLIDSEGVMLDANKVDKALKSIGVNLLNTNGEFRKLDDVFLEIASKWDSLSMGQQRYIATMAAGSRQQSRFIAMMSNYSRTMELVDAAYDANGASQKQFEKTLDSMEAKLNKLKNAWDQFTMGLMNNQVLKTAVDLGTGALTVVNKIIDALSTAIPGNKGLNKSLLTLITTFGALSGARGILHSGITSGLSWFKGDIDTKTMFSNIAFSGRDNVLKQFANAKIIPKAGKEGGSKLGFAFSDAFALSLAKMPRSVSQKMRPIFKTLAQNIPLTFDNIALELDENTLRNNLATALKGKGTLKQAFDLSQINGKEGLINFAKENGLQEAASGIQGINTHMGQLALNGVRAGAALQSFGTILQATPLAPFGTALQMAGTALTTLSGIMIATEAETGKLIVGIDALKMHLATLAPYVLIIGAVVGMFKLAYDAYNANNKALQQSQNTANAASEAYDSLKQSISELNNSIEEFQNSNNALDGLVAGTAAFNEQLAESNAQAAELIEKYDILSNEGYVTTGKNGEIEISDAGFEAVRKQQDELLQQASALSIIEANRANNLQKQTDFYGTAIEDDYLDYANQSEKAKRLEAQLKANSEIAYENAIKTLLNSQDLQNTATAQILAKNLTEYENNVNEAVSKKIKREAYAEFYGYKLKGSDFYDKDGNQVEVDDEAVLESYKTIEAFNQITIDASGLDKALSSADKKFSSILGKQFENSESVFADIMSGNIEADTDALKEIAKTPELLEKLADSLSAEELANILSIDPKEITSETRAKYNQMFVDTLKESTANVLEAQGRIYADLGTRYGQAGQRSGKLKGKTTASNNAVINQMVNNIDQLSAKQANSISTITAKLDERLGVAAADNFLNQVVDLYNRQNEQITAELDTLLQNSSWDSALDRLLTYEKLMSANSSDIRDLGKSMKDAAAETNVLGDAFLEVYSSEDFGEILKDLDKFKNSAGQIDATGVEEMRKESASLDKLLSLNAVSAGAFAKLLEGFNATGIQVVNESMLALLDSTTQVDNVIQKTHEAISNFDPGIDMGEGEDFVKENYEKIKAFYENGEFGNEELINRIKFVVDDATWQEVYKEYEGNLEQIEAHFMPLLETFKDGIKESWGDLANGVDAYGNQITDNTIKVSWADNGGIDLDTTGHTTPEVVEWLQKVYGVSEKMANAMLTDYLNYSPDARYNLNNADWVASLQDKFIPDHLVDNLSNTVVITTDELQLLSTSLNKSEGEIRKSLTDLGYKLETFDTSNFTLDSFAKQFGKENRFEWLKGDQEGLLDISSAITDMQSKGIDVTKAQEALYQGIKDQETVFYNGRELELKNIQSAEDLAAKMAEMDTEEPWYNAADTFLSRLLEGLGDWIGNNKTPEKQPAQNTTVYDSGKDSTTGTIKKDFEITVTDSGAKTALAATEKQLEGVQSQITTLEQQIENPTQFGLNDDQVIQAQNELQILRNRAAALEERKYKLTVQVETKGTLPSIGGARAKGQNNYISSSSYYMGSTAQGSKYGKVGPKGKGGLTLTGEEGYEIAWLPDESRSMILGAHGPQLVDLPSNAVIYTHEQSKKIVKQKSIPAGSHAKPKKGEEAYTVQIKVGNAAVGKITASSVAKTVSTIAKTTTKTISNAYAGWSGGSGGSGSSGSSGGSNGSGGSGGSGSGSSEKEKDPKRTNWYKEEITRYNLNQSINKISAEIEKTTKSIEKSLDKLGTKYSDIAKDVDTQAKLINQNIANQKALQKSYQDQINLLDNGGRSLWMDLIDSAGESSQKSISTGQFVYKQADDSYAVDKNKVLSYAASLGGDAETQKVNAETIFNTINSELNNLTSGLLSATKAIEDGKEELQNLIKQVQDAFYAWENELTKIYDLNQQLENSDIRRNRLASENSMLLAQISAGFNSAANAAERLQAIERDDTKLIRERINLLKDDIKAKQEQLKQLASSADEESDWAKYNWNNQQTLKAGGTLSINDIAQEQQAADKYLAARYIEAFTKITRNADNSITLDFNEKALENERLNGNISEATYNAIKEGFDALQEANEDLQQTIIDASDFMTELYEEYNKHIQTLAELEKDLIDAFVEAAQREVNKLEALNSALTNAAKAVLDQVKKNIDARRKSEDNAKTEGDIAQKQARLAVLRANTGGGNQVEIAQLEKEISDAQRSYGRTLEDQLMANMQSQADEASKQRQEQIDLAKQQIEYNKQIGLYASMADDLLKDGNLNIVAIEETLKITRQDGIGYYNEILEGTKLQSQIAEAVSASQGLDELADILEVTGDDVKSIGEELAELITTWNTQMMKQEEVISTGTGGSSSVKSPTVSSNPEPKTSTSSSSNSKSSTTKKDYSSGWLATLPETNSNYFSSAQVKTLQHGLNTMKWSGLISFGADLAIDGVIGSKTTAAIKALQKLVGTTQDGIWGPQTGAATHKKYPKYARGGLASKTGPAWLDGTPTKPELVLNAQDTKNFIALKDILSGVMRSISHTDTSNIYNSPTNFEINVNVEKIANDYDVDKLTERIKRNIVKDATYRNVTAVRNFR